MKVLSDILHKAGILKENAEAYSSGGYSVLVRNDATQRVETVPSSAFTNIYNSNGTLTGNRVVSLGGNKLSIGAATSTFANGQLELGINNTNAFSFVIKNTAGTGGAGIVLGNNADQYIHIGTSGGSLTFPTTNAGFIHQSSIAALYFTGGSFSQPTTSDVIMSLFRANKNVVIGGTTDAGYKLDVQGTGRFTDDVIINKSSGTALVNIVGGSGVESQLRIGSQTANTKFTISANAGDFYIGSIPDVGNSTKIFTINRANANVAIVNNSTALTYANQYSLLELVGTGKGFLPNRMTQAQMRGIAGAVNNVAIVNGGSGYTNGTYYNIAATVTTSYGTGTVVVSATVTGGVVTSLTVGPIPPYGSGYQIGDIITSFAGLTGGTGFQGKITGVTTPQALFAYQTDGTEGLYVHTSNNGWQYLTTGGNIYTADGTLTGNRTVTMGSNSLTFLKTIAAATNAEGIDIKNNTVSTVTNNSYSPSLTFSANGWGGTNANTLSRVRQYLLPVSGSPWNLPSLRWEGWNAYGDWVDLMTLKSIAFGGGEPNGGLFVGNSYWGGININVTKHQIDIGGASSQLVVSHVGAYGIKLRGHNQYIQLDSAGISFNNTTNEIGRFFPSTGNLLIQTGGTFTDAGYKLDVQGTGRFTGLLYTDSYLHAGGLNQMRIGASGGERSIYSSSDFYVYAGATQVAQFRSTQIQVKSKILIQNSINGVDRISISNGATLAIPTVSYANEIIGYQGGGDTQNAFIIRASDNTYSQNVKHNIYIYGGQNTTFSNYGDIILQHDGTNIRGNVGIGTTNPQRLVHIHTTTADSHLQISGSAPSVSMTDAVTGSTYQAKFGLATSANQFATGSVAGDFVISNQAGSTIWAYNSASQMKLATTGNLIIGSNTDAGYKLDVQGTGRFTGALYTGSTSNVGIWMINGTAIRGTASTGGNLYIDANSAIDNTGTINLRGAVTASSTLNVSSTLTVGGNIFVPQNGALRVNTASNGNLFLDASIDFTGNVYSRTTAFVVEYTGGFPTSNSSALFQINSTTKGFLPPRMTGAQVEAIASPAEGLLAYATNAGSGAVTSAGWWGYNGTTWVKLN